MMEIKELDIDGFGVKLFSKKPKYNDQEYALVNSMNAIQRQFRFSKRFTKKEVYQHGWCVLRMKKRDTIVSFEKALIYHLLRKELFIYHNHPESKLMGDEYTEDDQTEIILRDLIDGLKKHDLLCGQVLELYIERYSERDIAKKCGIKHHESIGRIIERGIDYVCKL